MDTLDIENSLTAKVKLIRKYLKLKLVEDNVTLRGHAEARRHVYDLMKRTVCHGESYSALIIGPGGCGKTTLINSVLSQLSTEEDLDNDAVIVKLNGCLHHDDKVALRSITSQMQLENAVGDRVFGSFAENLSFLLSCLDTGANRSCKSMIFILDEFERFCSSGKTQTLLYNLFDITHNKGAPLCMLGVSTYQDVKDLLEKRVKSRFSHNDIFLFSNESVKSAHGLMEIVVELLSLPIIHEKGMSSKNKRSPKKKQRSSKESPRDIVQIALPQSVLTKCKCDAESLSELTVTYIEEWNAHINSLRRNEIVMNGLEKLYYYNKNEKVLKDILLQLVCKLSVKKPYVDPKELVSIIDKTFAPELRVKTLQTLSVLELSLVIAMQHGMDLLDEQHMNFEMVLHGYQKFVKTNSSMEMEPRSAILKAFERLQVLEIIMPIRSADSVYSLRGSSVSSVQKEYKLYTLAVFKRDIQEAVKNFEALPTEIDHWFNNPVYEA